MRLTKTVADAAKYPHGPDSKRRYVIHDDDIAGFGLRVYPSGRRSFILRYSTAGRQRLLTLGDYGTLTVQEARKRALRARVQVNDGTDPAEESRRRRAQGLTLRCLAEEHLKDAKVTLKPATVLAYRSLLDQHIFPEFGRLQPAAITEEDVRRWFRGMGHLPIAGNRALSLLGKLLGIAERRGLRAGNPTRGLKRYREEPRTRYLTAAELQALGEALAQLEGNEKVAPQAAAAIRLLLFTGARKSEVLTLRWEHVDIERGVANLPDSKTGAKQILLPAPALEVLAKLPRTEGNPWVIEGRLDGCHLSDLKRPWRLLCEAAGLAEVRIHDLRHTVGSWGASGGASLLIIGKLLGHRQARTTEKYAHLAENPVREASESIAGAINAAMQGKGADVIDLRREA